MADESLRVIESIVRLRTAQCEVARADLLTAEQNLARVAKVEDNKRADRDAAAANWYALLAGQHPDPTMVQLAAHWLVNHEHDLAAARLDSEIAAGRRAAMQEILQQARARLDASAEVQSLRERAVMRRREEAAMVAAADQFLQGRRP